MRVFLTVVLAGCGASPPPPPIEQAVRPPLSVEWKAEQGDGHTVIVTIVLDRKAIELGPLPAATEMEAGTPRTCAIRAAHPLRTEFACGELTSFYAAELAADELILSHVEGATRRELQRIPAYVDGLAVKPYALPE